MVNINEKDLLGRLQKDDVKAFDAFYYRYHSAIYSNILKLTRNSAIAEDIVQEVFIALWTKRRNLDPDQVVSGWLFTVSYHKSVDHLKKNLKQMLLTDSTADTETEKEINLRETRLGLLEEAMSTLSPQKRKVFDLCKIEGKTYEEAAKEMQISKHTVKEYLSTAIASIKGYISQHPSYKTALIGADLLVFLYVSFCTPNWF